MDGHCCRSQGQLGRCVFFFRTCGHCTICVNSAIAFVICLGYNKICTSFQMELLGKTSLGLQWIAQLRAAIALYPPHQTILQKGIHIKIEENMYLKVASLATCILRCSKLKVSKDKILL